MHDGSVGIHAKVILLALLKAVSFCVSDYLASYIMVIIKQSFYTCSVLCFYLSPRPKP